MLVAAGAVRRELGHHTEREGALASRGVGMSVPQNSTRIASLSRAVVRTSTAAARGIVLPASQVEFQLGLDRRLHQRASADLEQPLASHPAVRVPLLSGEFDSPSIAPRGILPVQVDRCLCKSLRIVDSTDGQQRENSRFKADSKRCKTAI